MPKLPQPVIEVAWRQTGETGRIHYRALRADGTQRRLIAKEGEGLYDLLDQHLLALDHTGPASAAEAESEH
jgi:hypothetical protein